MKYLIIILLFLYPLKLNANIKDEIKIKLENTNNIYFKFIQKIDDKIEKGECNISYPKKIYCKYDDLYNKILVSNGKSLVINSKKIRNYLNYKLKDTPLNLLLDKNYLLRKLSEIDQINENNETYSFKTIHNENTLTIFFDKINYNLIGWTTLDIYQNKVETKLFGVQTNLIIDDDIFIVQKYIN